MGIPIRNTLATTIVELCKRVLTGVGPSMALGSQLENNQIALLVRPAHISRSKPQPLRRPPNNKRSLKRLLRNARLAPLPAKQRPLNHEISKKEKNTHHFPADKKSIPGAPVQHKNHKG